MSLFRALFDGFTDGVIAATLYRQAFGNVARDRGRIDRLCRELGWSVDERDGDAVLLHFNGPGGSIRKVRVADGDECVVTFSAHSFAAIPARNVPGDVLAYLLRRNLSGGGIGMWGIYLDENDRATFHVIYQALGEGLDAGALKFICESLASEAADFDGKLREEGLLR